MTCVQVTQRRNKSEGKRGAADEFFNSLQLTRHQARQLATELMLFAEGREVEELVEDFSDDDANFHNEEEV
jgi:hypothetical protein